MSRFVAIDLAQLPPPQLIEEISYEQILTEQKAWVLARWADLRLSRPDLPAIDTLVLENEPITIILEVLAYRETLLRALVNDKARAVLLAKAVGTDLDHLGALMETPRRQIGTDAGGSAIYQSDDEYREEIQLAPEAFSVAGPEGAYVYFARRSHPSLMDAAALSPQPGRVDVVVLARDGSGAPSEEAIAAAYSALSPNTTRPLTDDVYVRSASIVSTPVALRLQVRSGPAPEAIQSAATTAINKLIASRRRIGLALRVDALIGAARTAGDIEKVIVESPAGDVVPGDYGVVYASPVTVTVEVTP